jgi:outer membrane receptor protein involved in Fe transport
LQLTLAVPDNFVITGLENLKKMKNLLIIIWILVTASAQGQTIRGKVFAQKDKSPVQFASVGLMQQPDSNIVSGVITLTDGGYTFENVKTGSYLIKVSYVGFGNALKSFEVKAGTSEIAVDSIFLVEEAKNIDEVSIVAQRLKGKELVDRTVYAIPPQVAKTSNNGYDILKKIPQVNVDFQNNVSLNGSTNFIVQVDGRVRDKEFLAKLLPSDIETIEIISNPSGKYEGNIDGVINIILKKEARYGINGNASLYSKPVNKMTNVVSASLDYALGKITFYATGMVFSQNLNIFSKDKSDFSAIDSLSNSAGNGPIKVTSTSVNSGFDYYINDKNDMSLNFSYKPIRQIVGINSDANLYKGQAIENTLNSVSNENLKSNEYNVSLFYKKGFKKPVQEFTTEANFYYFKSDNRNDFHNTRFDYEPKILLGSFARDELDLNTRNYVSVKLNYVHPIGMSAKLETGYQFYYQKMDYDFTIDHNETANNLFVYPEYRNSLYAGLTLNLKKFGFQTMLRVENSNIKADSVTTPVYSCLLPSVNVQYKFSASHNIKFTYNRRINRPGIYDMNPYWKIGSNYDISQGNPDLKPEYRDRLQLTYTWNFGSNYFSPHLYYEILSDKIGQSYQNIPSPIDSTLTIFRKPFNLLTGYEFGGGINAMLWFVNINAQIFKGHFNEYTGKSAAIPARDYFSYSITSYAFAPLTKDKKANAYVFISYNGVNMDAQTKTYSIPFYGFGAQKQMKNHSLGFFYLLPFSKKIDFRRTETRTPFYTAENIIGFDVSYYIQFMYSYKFNKGKNVKKLNREVNIESDSKSKGIRN